MKTRPSAVAFALCPGDSCTCGRCSQRCVVPQEEGLAAPWQPLSACTAPSSFRSRPTFTFSPSSPSAALSAWPPVLVHCDVISLQKRVHTAPQSEGDGPAQSRQPRCLCLSPLSSLFSNKCLPVDCYGRFKCKPEIERGEIIISTNMNHW